MVAEGVLDLDADHLEAEQRVPVHRAACKVHGMPYAEMRSVYRPSRGGAAWRGGAHMVATQVGTVLHWRTVITEKGSASSHLHKSIIINYKL